jgi:hypothetical protein
MRKLESNNQYVYLPNESKYIWTGDKLPTIIDYGNSSFSYKNNILSIYFRADLGIRPDLTSSSMNDIIKLFSSLYIKVKGNPELYPVFLKIYANLTGVISKSQVEKVMEVMDDNFDYFPNYDQNIIDNAVIQTLDDLINYIESLQPDIITKVKPEYVLSCSKHKCLSQDEIVDSVFSRSEIQTVSEFLKVFKTKSLTSEQKQYLDLYLNTVIQDVRDRLASYSSKKGPSARDVIIFDQLYYIVKDLDKIVSGLDKINIDKKEIETLLRQSIQIMKEYQQSALKHLEQAQFILPSDQRKRFMERQLEKIKM